MRTLRVVTAAAAAITATLFFAQLANADCMCKQDAKGAYVRIAASKRTYEARTSIFAMGERPVRTRPVRFELDHPQGPDREGPSQQDLLRPF
jgi:hypothetical protein